MTKIVTSTLDPTEVPLKNLTSTAGGLGLLSTLVGLVMGVQIDQDTGVFVRDRFYTGCRILQPLSNWCGLSIDVANFLASALIASLLGLLMRYLISPRRFSYRVRASLEVSFGLLLIIFCFGQQVRILILQSLVTYLLLRFCRLDHIRTPTLITAWTMFYLMLVHLCRLYYDYEGYTLDISGPLMLQTQRLSSLAFNLYDGARIKKHNAKISAAKPAEDTECKSASSPQVILDMTAAGDSDVVTGPSDSTLEGVKTKETPPLPDFPKMMPSSQGYAVEDMPSPLEYAAYSFYFHGVCIGPLVFYRDYRKYLGGYETGELPPISCRRVLILLLRAIIYGGCFVGLFKRFPVTYIAEANFRHMNLFVRAGYIALTFLIARLKYYFAWTLAEVLGMCAGNGYTGEDPVTKETLWKNVHNFDFVGVEAALNLKLLIDAWNIKTACWLREVVYYRAPKSIRTVAVFCVSAFWHGLYPGYYLMFLTFALFTLAARVWRRKVRSRLPSNRYLFLLYHGFTILLTHVSMDYAQAPFHLLSLKSSLLPWIQFLFVPHIVAVLVLSVPPLVSRLRKRRKEQDTEALLA
ncbi:hypothetical protein AAHC03_05467 [Spirometra sp. Aus1]